MGLLRIVLVILLLTVTGFITIYKDKTPPNAKEQCKRASIIALIIGTICGVPEGIQFYQANNADMFLLALIGAVIITFVIFVIVSGLLLARKTKELIHDSGIFVGTSLDINRDDGRLCQGIKIRTIDTDKPYQTSVCVYFNKSTQNTSFKET